MPLDSKFKSILVSGILFGSAVILAIIISLSLTNFLGNSSMPNVAVSTTSMMPIYRGYQDGGYSGPEPYGQLYPFRGDILLIRKVPISSLEVGDVIVFNTPSVTDPVVHRIISKWQNEYGNFSFKTNGDNNVRQDGWVVSEDDVVGKVVFRIPHIGWFLLALQTNLGKIVVLVLAIFILFGEEFFKLLGLLDKEKSQEIEKSVNDLPTEPVLQRKTKTRMITRMVRKKEFIYSGIALTIVFVFILSNIFSGMIIAPSLDCYSMTDSSHNNSLLDSSSSSLIHLSSPGSWDEQPNQSVYYYPIIIEVSSGGFFNNIAYFTIRVNETKGLYRWDVVYNFIGTRTIKGGIVSSITGIVEIEINVFARGIFSSKPKTYLFPLILQAP
ncbi:MAG: signal peptidase I [Candidatus Hodarchaeales archaeon]